MSKKECMENIAILLYQAQCKESWNIFYSHKEIQQDRALKDRIMGNYGYIAEYLYSNSDCPIRPVEGFEIDKNALPNLVEDCFPKGECKERGKAIVLASLLCINNPIRPKEEEINNE